MKIMVNQKNIQFLTLGIGIFLVLQINNVDAMKRVKSCNSLTNLENFEKKTLGNSCIEHKNDAPRLKSRGIKLRNLVDSSPGLKANEVFSTENKDCRHKEILCKLKKNVKKYNTICEELKEKNVEYWKQRYLSITTERNKIENEIDELKKIKEEKIQSSCGTFLKNSNEKIANEMIKYKKEIDYLTQTFNKLKKEHETSISNLIYERNTQKRKLLKEELEAQKEWFKQKETQYNKDVKLLTGPYELRSNYLANKFETDKRIAKEKQKFCDSVQHSQDETEEFRRKKEKQKNLKQKIKTQCKKINELLKKPQEH